MASALHWIPDTLYNYSVAAVAANYDAYQEDTKSFPENILFDLYYQLYKESRLKKLGVEFSNLDTFRKLLNVKDKRCLLHNCFQAIMDYGCPVASDLAEGFQNLSSSAFNSSASAKYCILELGFSLGRFLLDAGWFLEGEIVFSACLSLCYTYNTPDIWKCILQCHTKLLYMRNFYCKFEEGKLTVAEANECIKKIKDMGLDMNFASIYGEFSSFYIAQSDYKEGYSWGVEALKELNSSLFPKEIVKVLCQAAKACIFKREFKRSEMLIKQALQIAKDKFGARNLCFATVLLDYGCYLLNTDAIGHAVKAYQTALNLHVSVFGGNNLLVAKCHEDLAYALYSHGYNTGHLKDAMDHAEKALCIMFTLLSEDNFLQASAREIKAVILQEMAFECHDLILQRHYFAESLELYLYVVKSTPKTIGHLNLFTAKFFGNLGQHFQLTKKYEAAEEMQQQAITIKEEILGPDDYEVGLSVHQLAALYTGDLDRHREAEILFLRSMEIGRKLFGESYSKLQHDYRGLLRVYTELHQEDKVSMYRTILHNWKVLRDQVAQEESEFSPLNIELKSIPPEDIMQHFISLQ